MNITKSKPTALKTELNRLSDHIEELGNVKTLLALQHIVARASSGIKEGGLMEVGGKDVDAVQPAPTAPANSVQEDGHVR